MSKLDVWMPLFIGDYIAATTHLTTEQHGAYLLLLMTAWNRGGKLPTCEEQLAHICHCDKKAWMRVRSAILPFFLQEDGFYVQERLKVEYDRAVRNLEKQRANGRKGGRPKREKPSESANPSATQQEPMGFDWDNPNESQTEPGGYVWPNPKGNPNKSPSPSPSDIYSDAYASGAHAPGVCSSGEVIFGIGVPLLVASGTSEKHARSFLGALRKQHGDKALVAKLGECAQVKPLQPLEWLAAALPPGGDQAPSAPMPRGNGYLSIPDPSKIDYRASVEREVDANGNRKFA